MAAENAACAVSSVAAPCTSANASRQWVAATSPTGTLAAASATIIELAQVLSGVPNGVRVEGYTDNQPIRTPEFRSNWDLSSARATNVVYELIDAGIAPARLAAMGYGEYQPIADNATVGGRSANRRVELVILASSRGVDSVMDGLDMRGKAEAAAGPATTTRRAP